MSSFHENIFIRSAKVFDAGAIARVNAEVWKTAYQGIFPDAYLHGLKAEDRTEIQKFLISRDAEGKSGRFVLENEEEGVVAYAAVAEQRQAEYPFDGELAGLYVLEGFQRRGYGTALSLEAVNWLLRYAFRSMLVWVIRENKQGRRFYEALGGRLQDATRQKKVDGHEVNEVAYGWNDLKLLQAHLQQRQKARS